MIKTILPKQTIGIIGGGQLGRMLAMSAKEMGYKIVVLDPSADACAKPFADTFIHSPFDDLNNIELLCQMSDVVTFEFENIDVDVLKQLEKKYNFVQSAHSLEITQNRLLEKDFAKRLNIPTVRYYTPEDKTIVWDKPYLMKTVRFGYDGKGQKIIHLPHEVEEHTVLEEFINIDKEISVVAYKDRHGAGVVAVIENEHRNNILYRSYVPAQITDTQREQAITYTTKILESFDYYGVMTVEYFVSGGEIIFNEIAPRVHNSGHITMQSANKSQFRAHIEAICGLTVGEITNKETTLYNILGQDEDYFIRVITQKQGYLHLYEKEARLNRKIGHINFYGNVTLEGNCE